MTICYGYTLKYRTKKKQISWGLEEMYIFKKSCNKYRQKSDLSLKRNCSFLLYKSVMMSFFI